METYIGLDIKILQIESMLPDINTNDWNVGEKRILISGGNDLETLGGGIKALIRSDDSSINEIRKYRTD